MREYTMNQHRRPTTRTVAGTRLTKDGDRWTGALGGEVWYFFQKSDRKWQGCTSDHLTGCPRCIILRDAVRWVAANQHDIRAKLQVRRAAGTRMVDPPARRQA